MTNLRTAAQQALEALYEADTFHRNLPDQRTRRLAAMAALRAALRADPAEPVEPVYWEVRCTAHPKWMRVDEQQFHEYVSYGWEGQRLYTAPPQRLPLTDEEILKAIGWERAEMYMKLTPNFPVAEAKKETLKNARAIERAHGIREQP